MLHKNSLLKTGLVVCLCALAGLANAQNINIPDPDFKAALVAAGVDNSPTDGEISQTEADAVTSLDVSNKSIADLTGIEAFTNLQTLVCRDNQLNTLNVSQNSSLQTLDCGFNQLTALDVSSNPNLFFLQFDMNQLTTLDVSNNSDLQILNCNYNQLTTLDVSDNSDLQDLGCTGNQLTTLDISDNGNLLNLYCSSNQLTGLDVSNNPALQNFNCGGNQLTTLDVSDNPALVTLDCWGNQLTTLDVSNNGSLMSLNAFGNQLTSIMMANGSNEGYIDFANNPALATVCCDPGQEAADVQAHITGLGYTNCEVRSDCSLDGNGCVIINFAATSAAFKTALLGIAGLDANGDNEISLCEAEAVTTLDVSNKNIASMPEIKYFSNLTWLSCSDNQLTALDISQNIKMQDFYCYNNDLSVLDVSQNADLRNLNCSNNDLTVLDVSNNSNLATLYCSFNQLTTLDASQKSNLQYLECWNNELITLEVSNDVNLQGLYCHNNHLSTLDVSQNINLIDLNCSNNQLTELNVMQNASLLTLNCANNQLTTILMKNGSNETLDCSGNPDLAYVCCDASQEPTIKPYVTGLYPDCDVSDCDADGCKIIAFNDPNFEAAVLANFGIDANGDYKISVCEAEMAYWLDVSGQNISDMTGISYFINLPYLFCYNNQLTALDLSQNVNLEQLYCYDNQLTTLDLPQNGSLQDVYCYNNQLTALDVTGNSDLQQLECYNNLLTSLDVSDAVNLQNLSCSENRLLALDVENNTALIQLFCSDNELTALDVSKNGSLQMLWCSDNQLTTLDVSQNKDLQMLYAATNQLSTLVVAGADNLTYINCAENQLTALDVSQNSALQILECNDNKLAALDVSLNSNLQALNCFDNQLTSLDVSNNSGLQSLYCQNNQLTEILMKNGIDEPWYDFSGNPDLAFVCCDATQLTAIETYVKTMLGLTLAEVIVCDVAQTILVPFGSNITKTYGDAPFDPGATASSNLPVTYASADLTIASVDGSGNIVIHKAGTVVITVSQAGDATYTPAPDVTFTLTVQKATLVLTFADDTKTYTGNNITITPATLAGAVGGATFPITYSYKAPDGTVTSSARDAGIYTVTATVTGDTNHNGATATATLTVAQAAGDFGDPDEISVGYPSRLTLSDLPLPPGYTWDYPDTEIFPGDGQQFPATYTDPSGNYAPVKGFITVNVQKPVIPIPQRYVDLMTIPAGVTVNWVKVNGDQAVHNVGRNYVQGHEDFEFNATYAGGEPFVVKAYGDYSKETVRLYPTRAENGSFTYLIRQVTEPWTVTFVTTEIESQITGTETVAGISVSTYNNVLTVTSDRTATADIYTMLGTLYRRLTVTEGTTREILPGGVYVIVI
ncbi:MAG: hypothetical protein LBE91_20205, partial [Tannerella sp.]|nr:hypothetical protein [Tannerella sp.]